MTAKPPRPGAHGEGIPDGSYEFVAEVAIDPGPDSVGPITYRTVGVPSKLGRAMAKPLPRKWYRVPVTALIYALNPDHARAIALECTKDLTLGGRAAWHIGEAEEAEGEH